MKKTIFIAIFAAAFTSCTSFKQLSDADIDSISWSAFCKDFGYNELSDRNNEQAVNEYLDCWCGSVAEERALAKHTLYE